MNSLAEALGMSLPGCAAIPAPYRDRQEMAYLTGKRSVELVREDLRPSQVMVRAAFENAIARLRGAGAKVESRIVDDTDKIVETYSNISLPEAAYWHEATLASRGEDYQPVVRQRLEFGRTIPAVAYLRAMDMRKVLTRAVDDALAAGDALVLPTLPIVAPPTNAATVEVGTGREPVRNVMLRLTQLFNVTGHPAVSIPADSAASGLPCGVQLVGCRHQTDALLKVALACEPQITGNSVPRGGTVGG